MRCIKPESEVEVKYVHELKMESRRQRDSLDLSRATEIAELF